MARTAAAGLFWIVAIIALISSCSSIVSSNPQARGALLNLQASLANPVVTPSVHANKHPEAEEVRGCENIIAVYFEPRCERFNLIKQMDSGQMANQVIESCKMGWLEHTAYYLIGVFDMKRVNEIFTAKGCAKIYP